MMTKLRPLRQLRNKISVCGEGVGATKANKGKKYMQSPRSKNAQVLQRKTTYSVWLDHRHGERVMGKDKATEVCRAQTM